MPDTLTPAELAEGLRLADADKVHVAVPRLEYALWLKDCGETALRELAALRAFREAVIDALRTYDDERLANVPPDAERGLRLFHAIEEALSPKEQA